MKKITLAIVSLVATTTISVADTPLVKKTNFDFIPEIVAEVNGKKLTKAQEIQKLSVFIQKDLTQKELIDSAKSIAKYFVKSTAILDAAIKAGFKPSVKLAVKGFNDYLKTIRPFRVEQIKKALRKEGMTLESFLDKRKTQKSFQQQMAMNAFLYKNVISKVKVSAKDAKAYYDANPDVFKMAADPKGSVRTSHILIAVKEGSDAKTKAAAKAKAEKHLALLQKDASLFGKLAEKESECPSSKNKGSLGVFTRGRMVPEFEQAVVNLKTGEISALAETKFGYHIIRRDAPKQAEKKTFVEVKDKLEMALKQEAIEKSLMAFIKKITADANAKIYIK